jgi:hypothetical protein
MRLPVVTCRLKGFKIHDYNRKSIKAVAKEAAKIKMDFELSFCVATIAAGKQKQISKSLEDPDDQ